MLLVILGVLLIGVASIMDFIFRERMVRAGHRWAMLQGGAFNYGRVSQNSETARLARMARISDVGVNYFWYRVVDRGIFCKVRHTSALKRPNYL